MRQKAAKKFTVTDGGIKYPEGTIRRETSRSLQHSFRNKVSENLGCISCALCLFIRDGIISVRKPRGVKCFHWPAFGVGLVARYS